MRNSEKIIGDYLALSAKEQIAFLRGFNQNLDAELCDFFLCIALDKAQENALRREAINVIGLFKGNDNDSAIKKALFHLVRTHDNEIKVYAINALMLMRIDDNDILFIAHLLQSNDDPSVQEAAIAFITSHSSLPAAQQALQQLSNTDANDSPSPL